MKTIGVIGGIGPQATMDFEARLHEVSQKLIPSKANSGYPPLWIHYLRDAPVKLGDDGKPLTPLQPSENFLKAAQELGKISDFLVITSNSPHVFIKEIESVSEKKVLSIIDVTLDEIKKREVKKVGLLGISGSLKNGLHRIPLEQSGFATETIDEPTMIRLDQAIFRVMEGNQTDEDRHVAEECVKFLKEKGCGGIILGCTEIPFLLNLNDPTLINPIELLAETAVRYAMN